MIDGAMAPIGDETAIGENAQAPATRKDALQHTLKPNLEAKFAAW